MRQEQLDDWLQAPEDEHLEFKEAKSRFDFEELVRYCAALANEGGGRIILGVTDRRPRTVVGTRAFRDLERTRSGLVERLHLRIRADPQERDGARVVVFTVPSRPVGVPIHYKGAYWMRSGDALVAMTSDHLKTIFDEAVPDFSAEICGGATLEDLDPEAVERFRQMWHEHSGNAALVEMPVPRLLESAELTVGGGVTFAALVLLGSHGALGRHLAQSEIVFEYRSQPENISYQQRHEYRQAFLLSRDELWKTVNLRNEVFSYLNGLVRWQVPAFNEAAVREAILNAVSHRDYRHQGSVFVRQWPLRIEITSPGGFPREVTSENLLWRQNPRNRRIAEAFARCGLVERSGQGAEQMFTNCVRAGKLPPDFSRSDDGQVVVALDGQVRDPLFLRFLDRAAEKHGGKAGRLSSDDLLVLDAVYREVAVPETLLPHLDLLHERGLVERIGSKTILAQELYGHARQMRPDPERLHYDWETHHPYVKIRLDQAPPSTPLTAGQTDDGGEGSPATQVAAAAAGSRLDQDVDPTEVARENLRLAELLAAQGRLELARLILETTLRLTSELGTDVAYAETQLALANLEIHEVNFGTARRLAEEAEASLRGAGMTVPAMLARIARARALLEKPNPDLPTVGELCRSLQPHAESDDVRLRFEIAILTARLKARNASAGEDLGAAREELERVLTEARAMSFTRYVFEVRLALAEVETATGTRGGDDSLETLIADAENAELDLIANRARALRASFAPDSPIR